MKDSLFKSTIVWIYLQFNVYVESRPQSGIKGFNIELLCPYTSTDKSINWLNGTTTLSDKTTIFSNVNPVEFRDRLSITGNHAIGEYHLTIATVKKTDVGEYSCSVAGNPNPEIVQLSVVEGPTSTTIAYKTQNDKLIGAEMQNFTISCSAVSEDPFPDMVLQINNQNLTVNGSKTIQQTLQKIDRTYDGAAVICLAGYQRFSFFEVKDSATIYLRLKPLTPLFNSSQLVTEETKQLSATCRSSGGRPKPAVKWSLDNADISSSHSTEQSTHDTVTDTYTVYSKLTYSVDRNDNGKTLMCGFRNTATGGSYVSQSRNINVKFPPSVSVENKTYNPGDISRQVTCNVFGNPATYTFSKWKHISQYGTVIRMLDGNSTLTLPRVSEEIRYQDTGEYICTVSNGIKNKDGNINQEASGFVWSRASPDFLSGDHQIKLGQFKEDIEIQVNVYSNPTYNSLSWMKGSTTISSSTKYTMTDVSVVITDSFHGKRVQVDGFRLALTIHQLQEQDFVNYTLRLANGVGQTVEHLVVLISASPPGTPSNFSKTDITESTITLQWLPGFDGGQEQMFVIQYRIKDNSWEHTVVPMTDHASNCRCSSAKLFVFTLTGLNSKTFYEIRIYAENKVNRSHPSNIVNVTTKSMSQHLCKTDISTLVGVAVGLSSVIIFSLVINGILTYKMLTDKRPSMKSSSNVDSKDGRNFHEVYYNISDDAGDKDEDSDKEVRRYETLGMKDKPNEYDVCEPKLRNKSSDELHSKAGQNYETLGIKDKPNVYEDFDQNSKQSSGKLYSNTLI